MGLEKSHWPDSCDVFVSHRSGQTSASRARTSRTRLITIGDSACRSPMSLPSLHCRTPIHQRCPKTLSECSRADPACARHALRPVQSWPRSKWPNQRAQEPLRILRSGPVHPSAYLRRTQIRSLIGPGWAVHGRCGADQPKTFLPARAKDPAAASPLRRAQHDSQIPSPKSHLRRTTRPGSSPG